MRILQVVTSLETGGAEHIVVDLSLKLMKLGHDVTVLTFCGGDTMFRRKLQRSGCKIIELGRKKDYYNLFHICRLMKIIVNYDIIHTHNTSPQLYTAIANLFCHHQLITTEHSTNNRRRNWSWYKWIDRWMYRQYEQIVCISDIAKDKLLKYLDIASERVCTINNGVDVDRFSNAKPLAEFQNEDVFKIVMVAGFREAKDQDTLIKTLSYLPTNFILWLVGDGVRRTALENLVKKLGLGERVIFLGQRSDIPDILKSSDVVVMSSHWEGLSLSNIEGMSVGKPFVATDVDGLREVTQGYGILVPHQDAEALAKVIRQLHDDREYYRQVADACYERAKQFDINRMVEAYNNVYKTMVSSPKSDIV